MACPICGNEAAVEHQTFGGGLRFHCQPCGGFFRISSTLETYLEGKVFDIDRSRERLDADREQKRRGPQDPNRPQDLEPTLNSYDRELLIDPE
ncbi:hypothetical protein [Pseudomonas sp. Sample_22]|uniref:hypothetical protein n=1 Tax=Pseudomonas sp. Sample_22 TaxID=2448266 RepID=UPI001032E947|nr:hypothetical protein [Pseudomonas sp. Sample_22]